MSNQAQTLQLAPGGLNGIEFISTRWDASVGPGIKPEDLLSPAFWAIQAMQLKPFDEIRARAEDGTWIAYLVVLDCSRTWARVKLDRVLSLTTADVAATEATAENEPVKEEYKVLWRGPSAKWSVVRMSDKSLLHEHDAVKGDAEAWLERYVRENAAANAGATQ